MRIAVIVITFIVLGIYDASAQYGYGGGYNRNRMGSSMMGQAGPSGPKEEPPTAAEIADERIPEYVAEFKLDPFETEVLRTYLEEHFNKIMALQKEKGKDAETMRKDFERMQNDFKSNLRSILTEEEVEKLITMDFSQSAVRKRKKERDN